MGVAPIDIRMANGEIGSEVESPILWDKIGKDYRGIIANYTRFILISPRISWKPLFDDKNKNPHGLILIGKKFVVEETLDSWMLQIFAASMYMDELEKTK
jgi:hypothetical protein